MERPSSIRTSSTCNGLTSTNKNLSAAAPPTGTLDVGHPSATSIFYAVMIDVLFIALSLTKSSGTDGALAPNLPMPSFNKNKHGILYSFNRAQYPSRSESITLSFSRKELDFDEEDFPRESRRNRDDFDEEDLPSESRRNRDDFDSDYVDDDEYFDFRDDYDDFEGENEELEDSWEWEPYQKTTHVYLPPNSIEPQPVPRTIVHFIGGTLFGSYPLQFYKPLLEQIAEQSNSIIVASSIPVSFQSNPLNHNKLTYRICRSFRDAYKHVICDEYGNRQAKGMKIVGMGHSLGTRLQCVISTEKVLKEIAMEREGNILISFNNFNAASTVPGVQNLEKGVKDTFREDENRRKRWRESQEEADRYAYDDTAFGDEDIRERNKSREKYDYRRREGNKERDFYDDYDDDDYDDDDIDLDELVSSMSNGIQDRITGIKTALTPDLQKSSLEFRPSPDELWDRIKEGSYNEYVNNTLIVQFDGDTIDQSSQLAKAILTANEKNETEKTDIKFSRLRGNHLTPVSYSDRFGLMNAWSRLSSSPMDSIIQEALGEERKSSKTKRGKNETNDVVGSIVKYIELIISPECSDGEVQPK